MITLVCGPRGSGKTTWCVARLLGEIKRKVRRVLVTNLAFTDAFWSLWRGGRVLLSPEEVQTFWRHCPPGSLVVLDEAQVVFNSRAWGELHKKAPDFLTFLSHSRKSGDDLILITQEPKRVDGQLRGQVDVVVDVNSTMWIRSTTGLPRWLVPCDWVWARQTIGDVSGSELHGGLTFFRAKQFYHFFDSYSMKIADSVQLVRGSASNVENLVAGSDDHSRRGIVESWAKRRIEQAKRVQAERRGAR